MAKFEMELPAEIIRQMKTLNDNCEEIFGEMTRGGDDDNGVTRLWLEASEELVTGDTPAEFTVSGWYFCNGA